MRSLEIIVSLSLAFGVSALAAPVNPRSILNTASPAHLNAAATDCERGTDVPRMLNVASPMATSSQDVSRSGDQADTATTTPESTVSTNVGGPVNQIPSSSASSAPSNLNQLNPVSDSVADGTSGDLSSTTSSLNAFQLDQLNPSATSTSNRLSQAADGAQLASTNSGAMTQYGASIGSDSQLAQTPNDDFQNIILSENGDRTMTQPSVQQISSQANTMVNTLGSNLNIPQNGAVSIGSILPADIFSGNGHFAPSIQGVSLQADTLVNTLGPNLNIPQTSHLDPILPAGVLSGNGDLATSIQGVSTKTNTMVNTLGSNLNILHNGVSSQANTLNTLGPNLNIPQSGAVTNIPLSSGLDANESIGTDIVGTSPIPMSSLTSPVQAASNTISDLSRQSSFADNFPDSLNTPRISNGVETPPPDHIEANTASTTTGNCICKL